MFTTALAAAALTGAACLTGMTGTASAAVTGIPAADNIAHPGGLMVKASGSGATTVSLNWSVTQ
jgi:hypothetical protein